MNSTFYNQDTFKFQESMAIGFLPESTCLNFWEDEQNFSCINCCFVSEFTDMIQVSYTFAMHLRNLSSSTQAMLVKKFFAGAIFWFLCSTVSIFWNTPNTGLEVDIFLLLFYQEQLVNLWKTVTQIHLM